MFFWNAIMRLSSNSNLNIYSLRRIFSNIFIISDNFHVALNLD